MEQDKQRKWELIAAKLYHELDDPETAAMDKLLKEEGNRSDFGKAEKIHDGLSVLKGVNKELSWTKLRWQIMSSSLKRYSFIILKYAAVVLLSFLLGNYFQQNYRVNPRYNEIEVMNGQMGHLFLSDSTEIWLNSGSRLRYPDQFLKGERKVFLSGEAFFNVTPDKRHPFVVETGKMEIEVLGTSFNVSAYREERFQSVVLVRGQVRINSGDGRSLGELVPGQRAVIDKSLNVKVDNVQTGFYTEWKEGKVVFDSERLGDIARRLERWYNVEIRFENEDLKNYRVSGTILRNKPIDQTISAIELLAPVRYEHITRTSRKDIINIQAK